MAENAARNETKQSLCANRKILAANSKLKLKLMKRPSTEEAAPIVASIELHMERVQRGCTTSWPTRKWRSIGITHTAK